jgi:hypothetical protein
MQFAAVAFVIFPIHGSQILARRDASRKRNGRPWSPHSPLKQAGEANMGRGFPRPTSSAINAEKKEKLERAGSTQTLYRILYNGPAKNPIRYGNSQAGVTGVHHPRNGLVLQ